MPIASTDIVLRLTTKNGSAGDTTASSASESLGKYVSTTVLSPGANMLFDNITRAENEAMTPDYRCIAVLNNHATLTLNNAVAFVVTDLLYETIVDIAVDNIGPVAKGTSAVQGTSIANDTTAPTGVSAFAAATDGVVLGNIGPGQVRLIWIRRTPQNGVAHDDEGIAIKIVGETS